MKISIRLFCCIAILFFGMQQIVGVQRSIDFLCDQDGKHIELPVEVQDQIYAYLQPSDVTLPRAMQRYLLQRAPLFEPRFEIKKSGGAYMCKMSEDMNSLLYEVKPDKKKSLYTLEVYNTQTGKKKITARFPSSPLSVELSSDGTLLFIKVDGVFVGYDVEKGIKYSVNPVAFGVHTQKQDAKISFSRESGFLKDKLHIVKTSNGIDLYGENGLAIGRIKAFSNASDVHAYSLQGRLLCWSSLSRQLRTYNESSSELYSSLKQMLEYKKKMFRGNNIQVLDLIDDLGYMLHRRYIVQKYINKNHKKFREWKKDNSELWGKMKNSESSDGEWLYNLHGRRLLPQLKLTAQRRKVYEAMFPELMRKSLEGCVVKAEE